MPLMIVSLIRVRSLTWVTVRPAWWRASARASPMATPRLPCGPAPHSAPVAECGGPDPALPPAGRWNHHPRAGPGGFQPGPAGPSGAGAGPAALSPWGGDGRDQVSWSSDRPSEQILDRPDDNVPDGQPARAEARAAPAEPDPVPPEDPSDATRGARGRASGHAQGRSGRKSPVRPAVVSCTSTITAGRGRVDP